ncbi:MAG: hypothetical protein ACTHJ0_07920 [Flavipsychrobacter sp.]
MSDKHVFLIKPSLFHRSKLLTITPEYIAYGESSDQPSVKFTKENMDAYRFGGFYGNGFLNMHYTVYLRSLGNKTLKIKEYRFLRIRTKKFFEKYHTILRLLYKYYFIHLANYYIELFNNSIDFEINGAIFSGQGVQFSKRSELIKWNELESSNHKSYYALYAKKNNNNYKAFSYMDDWNTMIVLAITRAILHHIKKQQLERNN